MRNSKKEKQKRKESIAVCFFRHNKMWKILINSTGVPFVSGKKYKQLSSSFNNHCFIIRRKQWHPTSVLLPGKSQGWRILVGCSPWGREESDTTEWLHFHFSLSCIGEGNGNPLQCSCLENPGTGDPGGLPSMGSHRVWHFWSDLAAAAAAHNNYLL